MGLETAALIAGITASAATAGTSIYGATQAGGASGYDVTTLPNTPQSRAAQAVALRMLAQNALQAPPTFADFLKSGGTATFPVSPLELTPLESIRLGLISPEGAIPFVTPDQKALTPEQASFLGRRLTSTGDKLGKYRRLGRVERRIEKAPEGEKLDTLVAKRDKLLKDLGVV